MKSNNTARKQFVRQTYYSSPSFESYIEQRLNKLNNNPIKTTKDERAK
jgi:hypothetical protein